MSGQLYPLLFPALRMLLMQLWLIEMHSYIEHTQTIFIAKGIGCLHT